MRATYIKSLNPDQILQLNTIVIVIFDVIAILKSVLYNNI